MIQVVECQFEVIFCLLTNRKCDFFQVEKAINQEVEWHLSHFLPIESPKFDFGDLEKAMFQVVARLSELVLFLLTSPKCELGEVEKVMFQGFAWHF